MRFLIIFCLICFFACSDDSKPTYKQTVSEPVKKQQQLKTREDTLRAIQELKERLYPDTPKILRHGDYIFGSGSSGDEVYFGKGFAPFKLEPRDILEIEQVLDSIMRYNKAFKGKKILDYKYVFISAARSAQTDVVRVQGICNEVASKIQWERKGLDFKDGGNCHFSFIYIFGMRKVESLLINESP